MTLINSFPQDTNVAIIGASGGIGTAIVELLAADDRVARIHALTRAPKEATTPKVTSSFVDLENEESVAAAAKTASRDGPLDLVFVASGILWQGDNIRPEKAMREINIDSLAHLFRINAAGPAIIAKHFLPLLRRDSKTLFAALSARVGSISDNRLGGWYAYRASKAALNMLLRTLAIEHARQWPQSVVVGLHPGTVDTQLSSPYTSRTPSKQLFSPHTSARHLVTVMDKLGPDDSGAVYAWDGKRIEF